MKKTAAFILFFVFAGTLTAQESEKKPFFIEQGIVIGYGNGIDSVNLPEGNYKVAFLMAHMGIDLFRNKPARKPIPGNCILFFEPQVNPVFIKRKDGYRHALEFGLNVGFQHVYPLVENFLSTYIFISTGPHFMSANTVRQAKGFLFSDNFGAGIYLFPGKNAAINLGFRLRHMSNADTRSPNQGINTFNYLIGFSKFIR